MRCRRATAEDAERLTDLARASKASWGYDDAFLAACRDELTLAAVDLAAYPTWTLDDSGELLGFYQLRLAADVVDVSLFFVTPTRLRCGIGRQLWRHLEGTARRLGARTITVDSDPNAEAFYRAMGMVRRGSRPSTSFPGRMLPHLAKPLAATRTPNHVPD